MRFKLFLGLLLAWPLSAFSAQQKVNSRYQKTFNEISGLIQTFYRDDASALKDWETFVPQFEAILPKLTEPSSFTLNLNRALARLGHADPALIHHTEPSFWLHRLPDPKGEAKPYYFGAWFERRGRHWYVLDVFPGSPAEKAGLLRGDEMLKLEGQEFQPILLTEHKADRRSFRITWRRDPLEASKESEIQPIPAKFDEAFAELILAQSKVENIDGKRIAYLRLPAMRSSWLVSFQQSLQKVMEEADSLILDLRHGHSGRDAGFLPLFFTDKAGKDSSFAKFATKNPIFILVDHTTKEGLEWLAYLLREEYGATLLGEPTAGQTFQTEEVLLKSDHYLLRFYRADPQVENGPRLGMPLTVDHKLQAPLVYARGKDEVLEQSFQFVRKQLISR